MNEATRAESCSHGPYVLAIGTDHRASSSCVPGSKALSQVRETVLVLVADQWGRLSDRIWDRGGLPVKKRGHPNLGLEKGAEYNVSLGLGQFRLLLYWNKQFGNLYCSRPSRLFDVKSRSPVLFLAE